MPSWRDASAEQVQDDLDGLLNAALPFAQQQLERRGAFYPYALSLTTAGEVRTDAAGVSDDRPRVDEVLSTLIAGLRAVRDELRATAVVSDVRVGTSDAIRVELEHRSGLALVALLPYRARRLRRRVEYGELSGSQGDAAIWPSTDG